MIYATQAVAKTPLSFREGRNNSEAATIDYIPGSALWGALVNAHRLMRPHKNDELETMLFTETTRLGNLYPAEKTDGSPLLVYPFPRTAHSCKRFGGFRTDDPEKETHGMFDHLIPLALFVMSGRQNPELLNPHRLCSFKDRHGRACREWRSPQKHGYYRRNAGDQWQAFKVKPMLRTHNGISRKRGAVQESILFSRSVLPAESRYSGLIEIDDGAAGLKSFIEEAGQAGMLRVGSNRSRGMGRVELTLTKIEPDTNANLAERLNTFNQALTQAAGDNHLSLDCAAYVPVTLTADAILVDHLLRYRTVLEPEYLDHVHHISGAKLVYSNAETRRVMGWNSLYHLPKADELAVMMGSVFLFGFETAISDDRVEKLVALQAAGIGLRRREGYGQLLIANPFHWEVDNV